MKTFISAIILLVVIIVGVNFYSYVLDRDVNQLITQLDDADEEMMSENWSVIQEKLSSFVCDWKETKKKMEIFANHKDTNQIDQVVNECYGYSLAENKEEVSVRLRVLKSMLTRIPTLEKLNLENIL